MERKLKDLKDIQPELDTHAGDDNCVRKSQQIDTCIVEIDKCMKEVRLFISKNLKYDASTDLKDNIKLGNKIRDQLEAHIDGCSILYGRCKSAVDGKK